LEEQTKTTQAIFFDYEERHLLARHEREIAVSGMETCRADAMRNSIPISNRLCRFDIRYFFSTWWISLQLVAACIGICRSRKQDVKFAKTNSDVKSDRRETRARISEVAQAGAFHQSVFLYVTEEK